LPLTVYNWKSRTFREVILVPSRRWPGEGDIYIYIDYLCVLICICLYVIIYIDAYVCIYMSIYICE
jgi:hypothetical protein